MSAASELGDMVVRLIGDGSSYQAMMKMADDATKRTADVVAAASNQIRNLGTTLQGFAQTAVSALTAFGLTSSLRGAFDRFSEVENQTIRLNAAMESNGENIEANSARYKQFAGYIDSVSTTSRRAAMSMLTDARSQGLSSEMAMAAVRNAVAFAAVHGGTAEGRMRLAIGAAQGNIMARGIAKYRNMTEDQKKIEFQKDVDRGMKMLPDLSETASAQLTKLGQSLTELSADVGGMVAGALNPLVRILRTAVDLFRELDPATKKTIAVVVALGMVFLAIGPVISTVSFVLSLFKVQQILGAVAWMVWNAAALTVSVTLGIVKLLLFGNVAAWLATKIVMLGLVPVLYLVGTAFSVMNLAVLTTNALFAGMVGGALYVGFMTIRALVEGVYESVKMIFEVFSGSGNAKAQLDRITGVFGEWWGILKDVFTIAQYNLPLAWELLAAGAKLAVMQVKLLFPPLWEFIKDGFDIVAQMIGANLSREFTRAIDNMIYGVRIADQIFSSGKDKIRKEQEEYNSNIDATIEANKRFARSEMAKLFEGFKLPEDSEPIKLQRAEVEAIRAKGLEAAKVGKAQMDLASGIGKSMKEAFKSSKIDAVEFGSAAALTHLQDYAEKVARLRDAEGNVIGIGVSGGVGASGVPVVSPTGGADGKAIADQATEHRKEMVERLREISANTEQLVRQGGGVVIKPAGLGG